MTIGLLTSIGIRHRYFARTLAKRFNLSVVGYEETGYDPASTDGLDLSVQERNVIAAHFAERERQESSYFGHDSTFLENTLHTRVHKIAPGALNLPATVFQFSSARIETLVVYGTNLLRQPWLSAWSGRIINFHLGISPYYRGTATNFYPLLNEEPQFVGATIHLIDAGIDSGPILRHARPDIIASDAPHTIGCKAISAGIDALIDVLNDWQRGIRESVPQWKPTRTRLYLRKDYHPRQVVELYRKLEQGMIPRYVERVRRGEFGPIRLVTRSPATASA